MKQGIFTIESNRRLTQSVWEMVLAGDTSACQKPGQFINIKLDGLFLRRPISVCDYDDKHITIIYKVVGKGTEEMAEMQPGEALDVLTGLGNGYDISKAGESPVLIGGGVGVPPMYGLLKALNEQRLAAAASGTSADAAPIRVILGFNTADEIFYKDEFEKAGAEVLIATVDGSAGTKGFASDVLKGLDYSYFYTCGPMPMFRAIEAVAKTSGQYSFEERMGCGFGACMGCSCKTKYGNKRICKDGPVLEREEIIW
jgi:dihydroorotate dehydrogenase electron transfer subunit